MPNPGSYADVVGEISYKQMDAASCDYIDFRTLYMITALGFNKFLR